MAKPHPLLVDIARGRDIPANEIDLGVVDSAIEHRLSGILLSQVQPRIDHVPRDAAGALLAFDMAVTTQRQRHLAVLRRLSEQLSGIEFAVFKGPVSAVRWFERATDRIFSDLDIVLGPDESLAAAAARIDPDNPSVPLVEAQPSDVSSVVIGVDGIRVDLQTEPLRMGIRPLNMRRWWEETEPLELSGVGTVLVFNAEADLALFLLHQARDRFRFLIGVAEARRRFEHQPDWSRVEALSRSEGLWDQVATAAACLSDEIGIAHPVPLPPGWRTRLWRSLWNDKVRLLGEAGRIRYVRRASWLMPLVTRGRSVDSLRWLMRSALPSKEALALRHPDASGPYLWRLLSSRVRIIGRRRLWVWRHRRTLD